jgi:F-type H+-transporting ATPase subunit a
MSIYTPLEHALHIPMVVQSAIFTGILLLMAGMAVRARLASGNAVLPDEGVSLRNVFEVIVEYLSNLGQSVIGPEYRTYFPVIGTIFFYVLFANVMGLIPGIGGPTGDINTTVSWGIIAYVVYNYVGIKAHGSKYLIKFLGPSIMDIEVGGKKIHLRLLAPLFLPLELLLLHPARIATLGIRLFANMFADHTVVAVWISLVPFAVPAIFMGLGLLVAFLQAFVFALLTMIYIGEALDEPH